MAQVRDVPSRALRWRGRVVGLVVGLVLLAGAALAGCPPGAPGGNERAGAAPGPASAAAPPILIWGRWGQGAGDFVLPRAVAVWEGADRDDPRDDRIAVADRTGRIQVFDHAGRRIAMWFVPFPNPAQAISEKKGFPVGITASPPTPDAPEGSWLVAHTHYQAILRYALDGRLLGRVGRLGTAPGEFTYPVRIACWPDGRFVVSEYGGENDRLQRFTPAFALLDVAGHAGDGPLGFRRPNGVALDARGNLYVCDANNHRIQKLSPTLQYLGSFGGRGREPGKLRVPYGIAYDRWTDRLVVAEYENCRLQVFTTGGAPLGTFGRIGREPGEFVTPWDVAVARDRVYVPDYRNHRLQVIPRARIPALALPAAK